MKRYDERDNIFSRMDLVINSEEYKDYYKRNPEKKKIDDILRNMPGLMEKETPIYDLLNSPLVDAVFKFLGDIKSYSEGHKNTNKIEINKDDFTKKLKGLAKYFGADLVGITKLKEDFFYSHRGRKGHYGEKIEVKHNYAIAFAVEMEGDMVNRAPRIEEAIETTRGYLKAAIVGMVLSYYLRELGYDSRNHMDGNYMVIAPFLAEEAGLGEVGRMGLLITKKYGPRVRLGVVTTELELIPDNKKDLRIKDFCKICNKCSLTCPGKAISSGLPQKVNDNEKWSVDQEKCYEIWRGLGSDCGVCLSTCPFSHNIDPQLIERVSERKEPLNKILNWYEERYKHRPFNQNSPEWI